MRNAVIFLLAVLALAGCRFDSTADLRSSARQYTTAAAFPPGDHVFQSKDQSSLLLLSVQPDKAVVTYQSKGDDALSETMVALLDSDAFPQNMFVAVALGGKSKAGVQTYYYYPFSFGKTHVEWHSPSQPTEVFGLADLADQMRTIQKGTVFSLVPPEQQGAVLARFVEWKARTAAAREAKKAAQAAPAPAPVMTQPAMTQPTVDGLTIGDGVHVAGVFSDSPSIIQDIDQANRRVKVRRYSDGISEWVPYDRIISREQSTVNNVARTGVVIGAFVCMLSPETCATDPK
ncbi:hypothetical protein [Paracoccus luteus]|uniref:hypothetical protein n=1 Tax=Paracoccus luteus TaxID=2508543 RepID=UPI00106FDB66|nr:hypothetical protein [Paracoccus luteus]